MTATIDTAPAWWTNDEPSVFRSTRRRIFSTTMIGLAVVSAAG